MKTDWSPPTEIDGVTFDEIYELFASSLYGEKLQKAIRYAPYKPEEISNDEWVRILGPDVNNLEHLKFTLVLTQRFLQREAQFAEEEQKLLCLTAVIHDWAEAEVGDIPYTEKNSEHEKIEFKILNRLIEEICGEQYKGLTTSMRRAANIALNDKESKLSRAFNAIEHIGYGTTALRAWSEWKNFSGFLRENLFKLANEVTKAHFPVWQRYALIFPGVDHFLGENERQIKEILANN